MHAALGGVQAHGERRAVPRAVGQRHGRQASDASVRRRGRRGEPVRHLRRVQDHHGGGERLDLQGAREAGGDGDGAQAEAGDVGGGVQRDVRQAGGGGGRGGFPVVPVDRIDVLSQAKL